MQAPCHSLYVAYIAISLEVGNFNYFLITFPFSLGAFSLSVRITDSAINPELRIHAHTLLMDQQSGLDYDHKKNQSI